MTASAHVTVRLPQMVYLGGLLLPMGSFQITPSPINPAVCDIMVVKDFPALPRSLREALDAIPPDATDMPDELQGVRAFMTAPSGEHGTTPVFVEVTVRNLKLFSMNKRVESTAPAASATVAE